MNTPGTVSVLDYHEATKHHFTVGRPLEDRRLITLPAYHHLAEDPAAVTGP
jgi:hypothetical protein